MNVILLSIGRGKVEHCRDDSAYVMVLQMKVQRAREVCESLYNTIEPLHLIGENINMFLAPFWFPVFSSLLRSNSR